MFWNADASVLLSSYLGSSYLAAQIVFRNLNIFIFTAPFSNQVACGVYFGNSVGAGKPTVAMQYYKVALVTGLSIACFQVSALILAREPVIQFFT